MVSCSSLSNSRFSSERPLRISGLALRMRGAETGSDEVLSPFVVVELVVMAATVAFGFAHASKDDCCLGAEAEEVVFLAGPSFVAGESAGRLFMAIDVWCVCVG